MKFNVVRINPTKMSLKKSKASFSDGKKIVIKPNKAQETMKMDVITLGSANIKTMMDVAIKKTDAVLFPNTMAKVFCPDFLSAV